MTVEKWNCRTVRMPRHGDMKWINEIRCLPITLHRYGLRPIIVLFMTQNDVQAECLTLIIGRGERTQIFLLLFFFCVKTFRECFERKRFVAVCFGVEEKLVIKMKWMWIAYCMHAMTNNYGRWCLFLQFSIISSFLIGVRNPDCWWAMTAQQMKKSRFTHTHEHTRTRHFTAHGEDNDRVASRTHPVRLASN